MGQTNSGAGELIRLVDLYKAFDEETVVLKHINMYIRKNEFLTLLGPSGCGKTTTLRIIGGFESPTSGDVLFNGQSVLTLPPYKRTVNTVFQKYALFPHMNVFDNIAFGLKIKGADKVVIADKVAKLLELVNLSGFEKREISQLSGGQQQRIAIARALVCEPAVLLLDEPLGALDLKLRKEMQLELKHMQRELGITFVYVTHDQEEALTMSDTIAVMNAGIIQQIGSPIDIYNEPKNAFVADFIGQSNIIDGVMKGDYIVEFLGRKFPCVDKAFPDSPLVDVVIRPEDVDIVPVDKGMLTGVVQSLLFKGVHYEMVIETNGFEMVVQSTDKVAEHASVGIVIEPTEIHIMKKPATYDEQVFEEEDTEGE